MIFIDSNIPMYVMGNDDPHKALARRLVETLIGEGKRLVTDAEVFQELIHRYSAIRRFDAIQPAFDHLRGIVEEVLPITERAVTQARDLVLGRRDLSARDALHAAVMREHRIGVILSFDRGFDGLPGISRIGS